MHLIQILLPLFDNSGKHFPESAYEKIRSELIEKFGGLTAFTRSPAQGLWKDAGVTKRDDIVVFEVMADLVDAPWWRSYRTQLEAVFRQDTIVVRGQKVTLL